MPLTLNLLHEEQKQLHARQRDPLKLGILALAGVAVLFMGYYVYRVIGDSTMTSRLRARQAEWAKEAPLAAIAEKQETELKSTLGAAAAVTRRIEGRFYWAPLLQTVQRTVPATVQITNFAGSNDLNSEKVTIALTGVAAGQEPRAAAEQFRIALADTLGKKFPGVSASFRNLEETPGIVTVDNKPLATAKFNIDVQLKKPSPQVEAPAAPARPRHK